MSFFDSLFGGGGDDSNRKQNEEGRQFVREQLEQTRGDIFGNFPLAQDARRDGFQSSIDLFGNSAQSRMDPFIQGSMDSQSTLLAGLPQIRNAILGGHVNMNYAQPNRVDYDTSWMNQTLPDSRRVSPYEKPEENQQSPSVSPNTVSQFTGGGSGAAASGADSLMINAGTRAPGGAITNTGAGAMNAGAGASGGGGAAAGGGGSSAMASMGPWAALAAAIMINENEAKQGGYRDEGSGYWKDLLGGKVLEQDVQKRWADKFGSERLGTDGDMRMAADLSTLDFSNAWDSLKNDSSLAKLLGGLF